MRSAEPNNGTPDRNMPPKLIRLRALLALLLLSASATKAQSEPSRLARLGPMPAVVTREIKAPFQILDGGALALGIPRGVIAGCPIEAYERPFLIYGTRALLLDDFAALRGRVSVRTPAEALALCRLRTSLVTYHVWGKTRIEVVCRDQVDVGFCFGDEEECSWLKTLASGIYGIVHSRAELAKAGIQQASVQVTSKGFEVRRSLLIGRPLDISTKNRIVQARELVTSDGGYKVLSATIRPVPRVPGVTWIVPVIM